MFIAFKIDPLNREDAKVLADKKLEEVKSLIEAEENGEVKKIMAAFVIFLYNIDRLSGDSDTFKKKVRSARIWVM